MTPLKTRATPGSEGRPVARLKGPLKWHGGKYYLTKPILDLMPKAYRHYLELYGGGLALLWARNPEGVSEVVNDLNGELTNFYRVLQNKELFEEFLRRVQAIPFSRVEWEDARRNLAGQPASNCVDRAVWFFVLNRLSLAGRMTDFTSISATRTRGGKNEQVSAWLSVVKGLPAIHARLMRVVVENRPAIELMPAHDVEGCVMYADPPYLPCTRKAKTVYGPYEMSHEDHREFLAVAKSLKHAKVLISGYRSELYDKELKGWKRHEFDVANSAAGGKTKRRMTEVVWCNF
jgi:DNA adenine methylase